MLIRRLRLDGFLSFAPGSEPFELRPLNVLIGPNASGKSNVIEALGLLSATSNGRARTVSKDGEVGKWLWKGNPPASEAKIEAVLDQKGTPTGREIGCRLVLRSKQTRFELLDESKTSPDMTRIGKVFSDIQFHDSSNPALVINQIELAGNTRVNKLLKEFFPRFERLSTRRSGGTVRFYMHESGFAAPIPATRLSDGTLRFIALLAALHSPSPPPLLCIEEPESGLHPDAAALVGDMLVEASSRMQLVVTTHSDALVSALTNHSDAIVACERPGAGTTLRRVDPAKVADWLQDYRLGDVWRIGALGANP